MTELVGLLGAAAIALAPMPLALALAPPAADRARRLLGVLVLWCLIETAIGLAAGAAGRFALPGVLALEASALLAGLAIRGARPAPARAILEPAEQMLVVLVATVGAELGLRALLTPVTEYDSLAYHLPAMASWVETHRFAMPEQYPQIRRYPYGWETLAALFLLPLRDDVLVGLPQLLAWVVLGLGIRVVAVELGASPAAGRFAAFLALVTPVARASISSMQVDLPLAAFFMAALAFALGERSWTLVAAALGLVLGVKASGVVYAGLVVVALPFLQGRSRSRRRLPETIAVSALALLVGVFWYARNLLEVGNPLGDVRVDVAGVVLFPGALDRARLASGTLATLFDWRSSAHWHILGAALARELGLPSALLLVLFVLVRPRRALVAPALLLLATAGAYWTTPYGADNGGHDWQLTPWMAQAVRYGLPSLALFAALAASGTSRLGRREGAALVVAALVVFACIPHVVLGRAVCVLVGAAIVVVTLRRRPAVLAVTAIALVAIGLGRLRAARDVARDQAYGGVPRFVAAHVAPDDTIGYLMSNRSYPFYGPTFTAHVVYLGDASGERDDWVRSLDARGVTVVAVGPVGPIWQERRELGWLLDPDGPFVAVLGHDPTRGPMLFRLRRRLLPAGTSRATPRRTADSSSRARARRGPSRSRT